jgi:hypothetical protein
MVEQLYQQTNKAILGIVHYGRNKGGKAFKGKGAFNKLHKGF